MGDLYCDPNQLPGKAGCSVITDTHVLQEVIDLRLSYTADDPTLELRVRTRDDRVVLLQLAGVKQIRLERLTPRFWLDELQIEDVRPDQLEDIGSESSPASITRSPASAPVSRSWTRQSRRDVTVRRHRCRHPSATVPPCLPTTTGTYRPT